MYPEPETLYLKPDTRNQEANPSDPLSPSKDSKEVHPAPKPYTLNPEPCTLNSKP